MSYAVRVLIALGGLAVFAFIIFSIRRSKMVIGDSIFWFFFTLCHETPLLRTVLHAIPVQKSRDKRLSHKKNPV